MLPMLQANRIGNACVRIYFIFNTIGIWKSAEPFPQVDLIMYAMDVPERVGPTTLSVQENGRHAAHPLTGTKVTSWLNNAWMVEQAHRRGYDDALLLNERGEVAECTAANIYCIRGGDVATPPLSSGCLSGVSRAILMEEGPQDRSADHRTGAEAGRFLLRRRGLHHLHHAARAADFATSKNGP